MGAGFVLQASTSRRILEPKIEDHHLHPSDLDNQLGSESYLSFHYNLAGFVRGQAALEHWETNPCPSPGSLLVAECCKWWVTGCVVAVEITAARWKVQPECMLALPANSLPVINIYLNQGQVIIMHSVVVINYCIFG